MNFSFPPGQVYNGTAYAALFSLNIFELFSHCLLDCPFSLVIFAIIWRTSILHPNLKFILLAQSACIFLRGISRTILLVSRLILDDVGTLGPPLLNFMIVQPTFIRNFIIHVLVIERIMATVQFKTYEKSTGCWFSVWWFTLAFVLAFLNALANTHDYVSQINLTTYCVVIALGIVEIVAFAWILHHNGRVYKGKLVNRNSLSEKYQLAENIRTAKQLIPCISLHFFNISYGAFVQFAIFFRLFADDQFDFDLLCNHLLYTSTTLSCFGIELSMIMFHPRLRSDLFGMFKTITGLCKKCLRCTKQNVTPVMVIGGEGSKEKRKSSTLTISNIHGKMMTAPMEGERGEEYFRQLHSSWRIGNDGQK